MLEANVRANDQLTSSVSKQYQQSIQHFRTSTVPNFFSHWIPAPPPSCSSSSSSSSSIQIATDFHNRISLLTHDLLSAIQSKDKLIAQHSPPHLIINPSGTVITSEQYSSVLIASLLITSDTMSPPIPIDETIQTFFRTTLNHQRAKWRKSLLDDSHDSANSSDIENSFDTSFTNLPFDPEETYANFKNCHLHPHFTTPITSVLQQAIMESTKNMISGEYEEPMLSSMVNWKKDVITPWLRSIVGRSSFNKEWKKRLDFAIQQAFCEVRISEMFSIIADYPDSKPAVEELKIALVRTGMHKHLTIQLKSQLQKRLLHPGANTAQIIDVYVSTIKVLRIIDPTDVLLEAVANPVKQYLQNRKDTVRCIVTSLTDEKSGGDLYQELRMQDAKPLDLGVGDINEMEKVDLNELYAFDEDEEDEVLSEGEDENENEKMNDDDESSVESATPTPTQPNQTTKTEVLSMLVGIYGSKELFVNEYRLMLADKLLTNLSFDTDQEVQKLELLKLRFGDSCVHFCEIMVKDLYDSRRINKTIHETVNARNKNKNDSNKNDNDNDVGEDSTVQNSNIVNVAILSDIFWPALQKQELKVHPSIQPSIQEFSDEYAALKNPRKLVFLSTLGVVKLDLELTDEVDETKVVKRR